MGPFGAVTKYSVPVTRVEELPVFLRQALREATSGTPGPTHLDLYGIAGGDVMTGTADLDVVIENDFRHIPATRPAASPESVQAVLAQTQAALRPIIVAGGGVRCSEARDELIELAEKLQVPVITSLNAKEMFPPNHELALGISGQYSRFCANKALAEADLVFFVGSHAGGQITNDWRLPRPGTRVLQLDINPSELGRSFPLTAGMQCDARTGLRQLLEAAESTSPQNSEARVLWLQRTHELVQAWRQSVASLSASDEIPLRPERLCADLTRLLPNDAVLVSDTGHSGVWTGTMIDLRSPGHSYIRCAGSLGWGLPAAIGAKCAAPERPVICFTGDGGMWYHLTELDTAVRYGLHTITLVNNNASLNQEQAMNERIYGTRTANSDRMWMLTDADFSTIASTMGGLGICVRRPDELEDALQHALVADRPVVIDVKTHIEGIAPRAWD
jgi:acetolactate synthase-1/2/3 large subunit